MSDSARQIRNSAIYLVPTVLAVVIPVLTLPILTRALGVEGYGIIALGLVYGLLVAGVAGLGLPLVYERNFFQYRTGRDPARLLYSVFASTALLLAAFGVATALLRTQASVLMTGSPDHGNVLLASYCACALQSLKIYFLTYLKNTDDAKSYAWYSVDETLLWTAFALLFVVGFRTGPIGVPLGHLLGSGLVLLLLLRRFVAELRPAFSWGLLKEALLLALPLTPRLIIGTVNNSFDKYLLGLLAGLGGVGVYSIGQKLGILVFSFMSALQNVFAPGVYRRMFAGGEAAGGVGRYLTPFAYVSVGAALLVALFAEEVVSLLTAPDFHAAAPVISVLAMYYAALFFGKQPQLIYARKTGLVSILGAFSMALQIAVCAVFINVWGVMGAAWGVLTAGVIYTAVGVWLGQRHFRIDYEARRLIAIYGVLLAAVLATLLLGTLNLPYVLRIGVKIIAIAVYLDLGRRFGLVNRSALAAVRAALVLRPAASPVAPTPGVMPAGTPRESTPV